MWNKLPEALTGGPAKDAVGRAFGELQSIYWMAQIISLAWVFWLLVGGAALGVMFSGVILALGWSLVCCTSAGSTAVLVWAGLRYPATELKKDRQQRLAAIEEFAEAEHKKLEAEFEAAIKALEPPKPEPGPVQPINLVNALGSPANQGFREYYVELQKFLQLNHYPLGVVSYALALWNAPNDPAYRTLALWGHALWRAECSSKKFRGRVVPTAEEVLGRYSRIAQNQYMGQLYPTEQLTADRILGRTAEPWAVSLEADMGDRVAWLLNSKRQPLFERHYIDWCLLAHHNNWDTPCVADLYYFIDTVRNTYAWDRLLQEPIERRGYFPGTGNIV